jgi:uncharacterized membrane protein YdjX (TVP38/TMEM64 family)
MTMQEERETKARTGLKRDLARVALMVALFAAVAYILERPGVRAEFDVEHLRQRFQARGWRGMFSFLSISSVITAIGVPRLWISVAAGSLFGAFVGAVLGQVASMFGAILNFYIARFLLRGPFRRRMPARMKIWYERFNRNGFRWLLYMRFFPLSNATLTNTVGGVSQIRLRDFIAATFLGYLPLTVVFSLFGSSAAKQSGWQLGVAALILVAVLAGRHVYEKRRREKGLDENDEPGLDQPSKP